MLTDYFFWFAQPGTVLNPLDLLFSYVFGALLIVALICWIVKRFAKNEIIKKLFGKLQNFALTVSIAGLVWFGFRYEATPVLSKRLWAGIAIASGFIWLIFILKYLIFNFRSEKREYAKLQIKNKYLP